MKHEDIDHTGLPGISSGAVATDSIWDAAGDLAVGSGANTAAKLAMGATNGMALMRVGGAVAWGYPPGFEFDYAQITSSASITATAEATADTVITGAAVAYDGSTEIIIEVYAPSHNADATAAARQLNVYLYDGSSSIGRIAVKITPAANSNNSVLYARRKLTPSAATHTYSIRAAVSAGTGVISAGAGGSGNNMPAYLRITKS